MFRSSTVIREIALNLAKVIFMLKHSVKLRRYLLYIINNDVTTTFGVITSLFIIHNK